jgi:hypothetical protein
VVQTVIDEVDGGIREEIAGCSSGYAPARVKVEALHRMGKLDEATVAQFAREQKFEETAISLSLLCAVSLDVVERALLAPGPEILLILVKLSGFTWTTAQTMLDMKAANRKMSPQDINQAVANFGRLNVGTARKVLGFYNLRSEGLAVTGTRGG